MSTPSKYTAILSAVNEAHSDILRRPEYRLSKSPTENAVRLAVADGAHRIFQAFHEALMDSAGVALDVPRKLEESPPQRGVVSADQYLTNYVQQAPDTEEA